MKKINYLGKEFEVPDCVKYVAQDDDGAIWGFEYKPYKSQGNWILNNGDCVFLGHVVPKSTLMEV